jgi:Flp pilus assembly protein TadD
MGDGNRRRQIDAAIAVLLAAATVLVYRPVLGFGFVNLDDPKYASENPDVAAGLSVRSLAYAFTTFDVGNWIPLTWLSYQLDASLFGVDSRAFHAVNLAWHAANVVLLFCVLLRMTGARGRSAAVALLFGLHPLHVESVAWISERKDVLSAAGLLLTLLAYEWHSRRPSGARLAVVCLAMALGLLAKPMLVTLPLLLLLLDVWPLRRVAAGIAPGDSAALYPARTWRQLVIEKTPLLALSLADGLVTIVAQKSTSAMTGTADLPFYERAGNAIVGYGWYLGKTVWPTRLCAFYPLPSPGLSWTLVGLSSVALIGLSTYVLVQRKRGHVIFGWLWFLMALLPVSGLVQVGGQAYADRYAYIPHIGLLTLIVWEAWHWLSRQEVGKWMGAAAVAAVAVSCAVVSRVQLASWRDSEALWSHVLALDPENYGAHAMMGSLRAEQRNWDAAERHFQRALQLRPSLRERLDLLARQHQERGDWEGAARYYALAHQAVAEEAADPGNDGRSASFSRTKRPAPSGEAVEQNRLGLTCARRGEMERALRHFREAVALAPEYAGAHNNAGLAAKELRRFEEAEEHLTEALEYAPENADFHVNLGAVLVALGKREKAREEYEAALRLRPRDPEARYRLEQLQKRDAAP